MKKHLAIIALIIIFSFLATQVGAAKPEIVYPAQYAELRSNLWWYFIIWTCNETNVDHYLVAVRKFTLDERDDENPTGTKIVNNVNVGLITQYSLDSNEIEPECMLKVQICAVKTDGTRKWSDIRYYYIGAHNGVNSPPLSFKIWTGFTDLTKNQIYYAAQTWHNAVGGDERVNTYPFSQGITTNDYPTHDGQNTITKVSPNPSNKYAMITYYYYNSSRKITEADINVNPTVSWANSAQPDHYDVQSGITHEMGHVLGLTDKYKAETWAHVTDSDRWTLYYKLLPNSIVQRSPEQEEIDGVIKIYSNSIY